jgi:hypothetical protein
LPLVLDIVDSRAGHFHCPASEYYRTRTERCYNEPRNQQCRTFNIFHRNSSLRVC